MAVVFVDSHGFSAADFAPPSAAIRSPVNNLLQTAPASTCSPDPCAGLNGVTGSLCDPNPLGLPDGSIIGFQCGPGGGGCLPVIAGSSTTCSNISTGFGAAGSTGATGQTQANKTNSNCTKQQQAVDAAKAALAAANAAFLVAATAENKIHQAYLTADNHLSDLEAAAKVDTTKYQQAVNAFNVAQSLANQTSTGFGLSITAAEHQQLVDAMNKAAQAVKDALAVKSGDDKAIEAQMVKLADLADKETAANTVTTKAKNLVAIDTDDLTAAQAALAKCQAGK